MKLLVAIVQDQDAGDVVDALVANEYRVTRINTRGGFLKRGNATLLIGAEDDRVEAIVEILRAYTTERSTEEERRVAVGAGTVFVLPVAAFDRV